MSMPNAAFDVILIDAAAGGRPLVPATLYRGYPPDWVEFVEYNWGDFRRKAASSGGVLMPVEHAHWDWRDKKDWVEGGSHRLVAVATGEEVQGMMAVERAGRASVLSSGSSPVVYVDYLETAPWNLFAFGDRPRYAGVGTVLVADAVRMSVEAGFGGRVGLHSLPQAEAFYTRVGMSRVGPDATYFNLSYFDFTEERAIAFLTAAGSLS